MKSYSITKTITFWGGVLRFIIVWFIAMFVFAAIFGNRDSSGISIMLAANFTAFGWVIVFYFATFGKLKKHSKAISSYAQKHSVALVPVVKNVIPDPFKGVSVAHIHGARDVACMNTLSAADWDYTDLSYKIYRKSKYSEYHTATIYYSIASIKLSRKLPHIFFDSKKARKTQFRFEFDGNQKLSFEGNFDDHFVSYCPEGYKIDSLSFISPEVMEAILEAKEYDLEIVGDRLYLYSSIQDPEQQINDMVSKLKRIEQEMAKNIRTYRDERLPTEVGRETVSIQAAKLKKSKFWTILGIIFTVLILLLILSSMR